MRRRSQWRVLQLAVLAIWAAVCLFPLYWLAITSIKAQPDIDRGPYYVPFVDFQPSLASWRFIFADPHENLVRRFINSVLVASSSTALTTAMALLALYGLTRCRPSIRWPSLVAVMLGAAVCSLAPLAGSPLLADCILLSTVLFLFAAVALRHLGAAVGGPGTITLMLASRALPPVTILVPIYIMASAARLLDTLTVLIIAYTAVNLPVALWLLQPVLGSRASEQEEAAQIEGASHPSILFGIVLPMVRGSAAAASLVIFLLCWNEYLFAAYLTSDHALTLPPWMVGQLSMKEAQVGGEVEELAHLSAATVLMAVPALGLAAFAHQLIARSAARKSIA
jgi:multiple sugar transport system permease protein